MRLWILLLLIGTLLLAGCTGPSSQPLAPTPCCVTIPNSSNTPANATVSPAPSATPDPIVVFETTKGNFTAVIDVNEAPITGTNFMKLVNAGFYNNLTFHRVVPGFVAQGGDPLGDGTGGARQKIPLEIIPSLTHKRGALAMARASDPDSASSQFYIVLDAAACAQLDGNYAVFGQVQGDGMRVVDRLNAGEPPPVPDRMVRVYEQKQ